MTVVEYARMQKHAEVVALLESRIQKGAEGQGGYEGSRRHAKHL